MTQQQEQHEQIWIKTGPAISQSHSPKTPTEAPPSIPNGNSSSSLKSVKNMEIDDEKHQKQVTKNLTKIETEKTKTNDNGNFSTSSTIASKTPPSHAPPKLSLSQSNDVNIVTNSSNGSLHTKMSANDTKSNKSPKVPKNSAPNKSNAIKKKKMVRHLLLLCLEKMLNAISRRYRDLRSQCIETRDLIKSLPNEPKNGDEYFGVFKVCCLSQVPYIVEITLDCMQKLIASQILVGKLKIKENNKNNNNNINNIDNSNNNNSSNSTRYLVDEMVCTICECAIIDSDKVHLQIVKAILTIATSPGCEVHGQSLLMCLRACYSIFLTTKNVDVQTSGMYGILFCFLF